MDALTMYAVGTTIALVLSELAPHLPGEWNTNVQLFVKIIKVLLGKKL